MFLVDLIVDSKTKRTPKMRNDEKKIIDMIDASSIQLNNLQELIHVYKDQFGESCPSELKSVLEKSVQLLNTKITQMVTPDILMNANANTEFSIGFSYDKWDNKFKVEKEFKNIKILKQPKVDIKQVLDVSNKVGLVCMPELFANYDVIDSDPRIPHKDTYYGIYPKDLISHFEKECSKYGLTVWMVAPIKYYSVSEHAKNTQYEMYSPDYIRQSLMAVKIILPMLINMTDKMEKLSSDVAEVKAQIKIIKGQIEEQQNQIRSLQVELEVFQARQAAEKQARDAEFNALVQSRQQIMWADADPLLIAVPSHVTNINTYEGDVFLGPCWGPEVDDVIIQLHEMNTSVRKNYYQENLTRWK